MKALIIAENEEVIERVSSVVKTAGYDTIVYRWLLKALDNIEEISPHLIIVSSKDYPRHWKTLAQFTTMDLGGYRPQIILFTGGELSEEEMKKAEALHVRGAFSSIAVDGLDVLREILAREDDIYAGESVEPARFTSKEPLEEEAVPTVSAIFQENALPTDDENEIATVDDFTKEDGPVFSAQTYPCTLVFTNPINGAIVTGVSRNYDGNTVEFEPDFDTPQLEEGTEISSVSVKTGETITAFRASVISAANPLILKLA